MTMDGVGPKESRGNVLVGLLDTDPEEAGANDAAAQNRERNGCKQCGGSKIFEHTNISSECQA